MSKDKVKSIIEKMMGNSDEYSVNDTIKHIVQQNFSKNYEHIVYCSAEKDLTNLEILVDAFAKAEGLENFDKEALETIRSYLKHKQNRDNFLDDILTTTLDGSSQIDRANAILARLESMVKGIDKAILMSDAKRVITKEMRYPENYSIKNAIQTMVENNYTKTYNHVYNCVAEKNISNFEILVDALEQSEGLESFDEGAFDNLRKYVTYKQQDSNLGLDLLTAAIVPGLDQSAISEDILSRLDKVVQRVDFALTNLRIKNQAKKKCENNFFGRMFAAHQGRDYSDMMIICPEQNESEVADKPAERGVRRKLA